MLPLFVSTRFQVLFHSPPGVLFTFPSQYCFSIGHWGVFRLGGWSLLLPTGFLVSRGTLDPAGWTRISPTGLSPSLAGFPKTIRLYLFNTVRSPQPQKINLLVWPSPISLAATFGIEFSFFSCCYLDVSVHSVPLLRLCIYLRIHELPHAGSPIRISAALWIFAPPRGFSQLIASFFGSQCQGIPLVLFFAWPSECSSVTTSLSSSCFLLSRFSWLFLSLYSVFNVQASCFNLQLLFWLFFLSISQPLVYNSTSALFCQQLFLFFLSFLTHC